MYPWIFLALNPILSSMNSNSWALSPNHTNIIEIAHAHRNAETSIGVPVLTAVEQ